jgi:hypothetical protein
VKALGTHRLVGRDLDFGQTHRHDGAQGRRLLDYVGCAP